MAISKTGSDSQSSPPPGTVAICPALQQREGTLGAILSALPDALFLVDDQDRVTKVHGADDGLRPLGMLGRLLPGDLAAKVRECCRQALLTREKVPSLQCRHAFGDDPRIWEARFKAAGPRQVLVVVRDITAQSHAEEQLHEREERYRTQFDLASEGVLTHSISGEILEVNQAFARMHGYMPEELLGMNVKDLITTSRIQPERYQRILAGEAQTFEVAHLRKDGRSFPVEVSANLITSGKDSVILAFHRDITERKRTEEELRKSEGKHRLLFESAGDAIFIHDLEGSMLAVNPLACERLGYTHDELMAMKIHLLDPPEQGPVAPGRINKLMAQGYLSFETPQRCKDGSTIPTEVNARRIIWDGQPAMMGICRDLTERKQAELERSKLQAQLLQSQKMESLGALAGGVAHDMNNVLSAILGLASAHLAFHPPESPAHRAFETISQAAVRGGRVVKNLLGFTRQEPIEVQDLDINALLLEEVRLLERTTLSRIDLVTDLAPDLSMIRGAAANLANAFMNIFVNALDAMPDRGSMAIRTRNADSEWIEITVGDTGTGMPEEVLAKALDPFFTTKGIGKGTGLGLSMVYGTVQAHHGKLEIQSQPGLGTCVRVLLPAAPASAPAHAPAPPEAEPGQAGLKVLLVDDDELIQSSVQEVLEILGHTVKVASSGEQALQDLAGGLPIDVVILDLNMPGLGGAGTLPRLRSLLPSLPVLLATGRADPFAEALVQAHPHVRLLPKPFSIEELRQHLQLAGRMGQAGF